MPYTITLMTTFSIPPQHEPLASSETEQSDKDLHLAGFSAEQLAELMATTPLGDDVGCPTDPNAPLLPFSDLEPPPVSRLPPEIMATAGSPLSKQGKPDRETIYQTLVLAFSGETYETALLPPSKIMWVALARLLLQRGVTPEELAAAVLSELHEP